MGRSGLVYYHGHFDVVPAQSPAQFEPQRRDGRIIGRGTADSHQAAATAGATVEVDVLQAQPSGSTKHTQPAAQTLARCVEVVEGSPPSFEMCPGVLDTRWYSQLGIPAIAYGGGRLDVSHGPDECIDVAAMRRCAAAYALFAGDVTRASD